MERSLVGYNPLSKKLIILILIIDSNITLKDYVIRTSLYVNTNGENLIYKSMCVYKKYLHSRINSYCGMNSIVLRVR